MKGQRLAAQKKDVVALVKSHRMRGVEQQARLRADPLQPRVDAVGVHAIGHRTLQAQHHGGVGAVAFSGGAQRAVEPGLDPRGALDQTGLGQSPDEHGGGFHRPDGVR